MNILIAPDKFKGSLSSFQVCESLEKGLLRASPALQITSLPLADGGDGLTEVLGYYLGGTLHTCPVQNPVGDTIQAEWILTKDGSTAIIEMAKASGLSLLHPGQYNPSLTSTYGTGQLIKAAIQKGVTKIILGLGGSASNDGGAGMAAALGYRFMDNNGHELPPIGGRLGSIAYINKPSDADICQVEFMVACDVKNPLTGPLGATHVYAPQKGADQQMVEQLEQGMIHYSALLQQHFGADVSEMEGAGAAGGLGAGCLVFLNAKMVSGIDLVMEIAGLEEHLKNADLVVTGEGKLDAQSLQGKVVAGVCTLSKKHGKRTIIVCGSNELDPSELDAFESPGVVSISRKERSLRESMDNAGKLVEEAGFEIGTSLIKKGA